MSGTTYTVTISSAQFGNTTVHGAGPLSPITMVYKVTGTEIISGDTIIFTFAKMYGYTIQGAFVEANTVSTPGSQTLFTSIVCASGTYSDTVTVKVGGTLAVNDLVVCEALYGV